jgi:hypothetical protein
MNRQTSHRTSFRGAGRKFACFFERLQISAVMAWPLFSTLVTIPGQDSADLSSALITTDGNGRRVALPPTG